MGDAARTGNTGGDIAALRTARRWLVVGAAGSGKSTLSRQLASVLDLPLVHLDMHFWGPNWTPTPGPEWTQKVREFADEEAWVMDGNYSGTIGERLPRTQVMVVIVRNPWQCLWRVIGRRRSSSPRPDIPESCVDRVRLSDAQFFWWILTYRRRSMPKVLRRAGEFPGLVLVTLHDDSEVSGFLSAVAG